jgi:CheY-like chemotaxis protein
VALKLLIADDNPSVRRLIRKLVGPFVSEIWECENGEKAVSSYSAWKPDLVFMDIRMDPVDGIEATRLIMSLDSAAKIVIVTDYDDEVLREAARKAGAFRYAHKENLLDLIGLLKAMTHAGSEQPKPQQEDSQQEELL